MNTPRSPDNGAEIDARVGALVREASRAGRPFDFSGLAAQLENDLRSKGASGMDPPDEAYWREVLRALRRRAGLPV